MSKKKTVFLPAFHSMTIVADSLSSGEVFQVNSGSNSSNHTAISASSTTVIDPIATPRTMAIRSDTGLLVETIAPDVALTQDASPQLIADLDLDGNNIDFPTTANIDDVIDDDTMASATATSLATSESIKAYVDSAIGGTVAQLNDLSDVTVASPSVNEALLYNDVSGDFENTPVTATKTTYDNSSSGLSATETQSAIDEVEGRVDTLESASHAAITLNADSPTQETLNLSTQELQVNLATITTDGAMSAEDKSKLDGIEASADVTDEANVTDALDGATLVAATVAVDDKVLIQDSDDSNILKTATVQSIADLASITVGGLANVDVTQGGGQAAGNVLIYNATSTNWENAFLTSAGNVSFTPGDASVQIDVHDAVTLNADAPTQETLNLSSQELQVNLATTTTDGAMSAEDKLKLDNIEASADVTDEANVTDALDGATLVAATVAGTDKVLIQDTDDSDVLKTVTAQSIADLAAGGASDLDDLSDVTITTPSAGQVMIYDATAGYFENAGLTAGTNISITPADGAITVAVTGIESGADVTDAANVTSSLSGAAIGAVTVATDDKVLIQDTSDSSNLKSVTAQSIADLAASGMSNPMTTAGDIIIGGSSGTPTRLAASDDGKVLTLNSGAPSWQSAGGGEGVWVKLSTVDISTPSAGVEFTGLDDTYSIYYLKFENVGSGGGEMILYCSTDNGTSYDASSHYSWNGHYVTTANTNVTGSSLALGNSVRLGYYSSDEPEGATGGIYLFNIGSDTYYPTIAAQLSRTSDTGALITYYVNASYVLASIVAVDAIKICRISGDALVTGGTLTLYGLAQ